MAHEPSDLEDVFRRLRQLEDERAIFDLLYRYGHAIDYGLEDEWIDCFVQDGIFDRRLRQEGTSTSEWRPLGPRLEGHADLASFVSSHSRAPERFHKHLLLNPRIVIAEDDATVQSYFLFITANEGRCVIGAFGRYLDNVVRSGERTWRLKQRIAEIEAIDPASPPPLRGAR
jgi:hypothetical protein